MANSDVLLLKPVDGLGAEGDQVKVRAGYARNFLLPQGMAVPLTVATSRADIGERVKARHLLVTPEESWSPTVLRQACAYANDAEPLPSWSDAVTDPWLFDVVRSAMGQRNTTWGVRGKARRRLVRGLIGPQDTERLSNEERMHLLSEPQSIVRLRDQLAANSQWGSIGHAA